MEYEIRVRPSENRTGTLGFATVLLKDDGKEFMLIQNIKLVQHERGQFRVLMPLLRVHDSLLPAVIIKDVAFTERLTRDILAEYEKSSKKL